MFRKSAAAVVAIAATMSLVACGGSGESAAPPPPVATSSAAAGNAAMSPTVAPTAAQLNSMIQVALDPDAPVSEKVKLVQGATVKDDAALFEELVKAHNENPDVKWTITSTHLTAPGQATASFMASLGSTSQSADVVFVFEDGSWKMSHSFACNLLGQLGRKSAGCAT